MKLRGFIAAINLGGGYEVLNPENVEKCHRALGKVNLGHDRNLIPAGWLRCLGQT